MKKLINALRPTERLIFFICGFLLILSGLYILDIVNKQYSTEIPVRGGSYTEGIVGYARYINPVLAYTDADKDMIHLIFSGLLKPSPEGKLVGDLAESWNISEDGLTYSFTLKPGLTFHDGTSLTTDDIAFTIEKMRDPEIKSPKADIWNGVKVEVLNERDVTFTLKKAYAPFLENLTFGIIPKNSWKSVESQVFDVNTLNREPIGSGPYRIKKAHKNSEGIYEYYDLAPFERYSLGAPYIKNLRVRFFRSEQEALSAYKQGRIDALGGIDTKSASELKAEGHNVMSTSLPRIFALFLNQSESPVLLNKEVRQALNVSVNRDDLIDNVLNSWGTPATGPIPADLQNATTSETLQQTSSTSEEQFIEAGKAILAEKGWKQNSDGFFEKQVSGSTQILRFSISTSNAPELKNSAEFLKETWTKLGADVTVEVFEPSDLTQKVIRPRKYQTLLFGNVIGRDLDLYPFWHSSERNDPGLNTALYTNIKADRALETLRSTSEESKKLESRQAFQTEMQNDIPAIFLYSPGYIYATDAKIKDASLTNMTSTSERFMNIEKWYIETERIWNFFLTKGNNQ
ncbi:MAG TPA: peptide ABC transporter substrate-binding protein [Candidatus Paceibacterota bacterium]